MGLSFTIIDCTFYRALPLRPSEGKRRETSPDERASKKLSSAQCHLKPGSGANAQFCFRKCWPFYTTLKKFEKTIRRRMQRGQV